MKQKKNHINWTVGLKCDHRVWPWPWPWPWIFKVRYRICQKWYDCHETKSKHIELQCLKCGHQVWPLPWPSPWIFKVKSRISYFSAKNGPIATKPKANISFEFQASNVTNGFDLDHNLDLWILKVRCDLHLWPHTWHWPWIFMVKFWNSCISEWEGCLTLHKGGGSRSFMPMPMTIWWPRSGVWICQIVTGVTSVVGVLSTHLVSYLVITGWQLSRPLLEPLVTVHWHTYDHALISSYQACFFPSALICYIQ